MSQLHAFINRAGFFLTYNAKIVHTHEVWTEELGVRYEKVINGCAGMMPLSDETFHLIRDAGKVFFDDKMHDLAFWENSFLNEIRRCGEDVQRDQG